MTYSFEMVLVGMILLTAMAGIGITLRIRRKKQDDQSEQDAIDDKYQDS